MASDPDFGSRETEPTDMWLRSIGIRRIYARWKVQVEPTLIGKIEQVVEGTRKS